jgi:hypothetical protein
VSLRGIELLSFVFVLLFWNIYGRMFELIVYIRTLYESMHCLDNVNRGTVFIMDWVYAFYFSFALFAIKSATVSCFFRFIYLNSAFLIYFHSCNLCDFPIVRSLFPILFPRSVRLLAAQDLLSVRLQIKSVVGISIFYLVQGFTPFSKSSYLQSWLY